MSVKTASARTGNAILDAANFIVTAAHDNPRKEKIALIDETIKMLQEDRARLVEELIDSTDI